MNRSWEKFSNITTHIIYHSCHPNYNICFYHGEKELYLELPSFSASGRGSDVQWEDKMAITLVDLVNEKNFAHADDNIDDTEPTNQEASTFAMMFAELQSELWSGCTKMSSFNFLVKLIHLKFMHKGTNRSFNRCDLLKISHPDHNKVHDSYYDVKKKLHTIGLGYESIHVCKYDCTLFCKENATSKVCLV